MKLNISLLFKITYYESIVFFKKTFFQYVCVSMSYHLYFFLLYLSNNV